MFKKLLQKNNIQVTVQRIEILKTLQFLKKPVTIDELKKNLSLKIDKVTLYRFLALLSKKGIVYQTDFRKGVSYYEFQDKNYHHHHLVCTSCGKMKNVSFCPDSFIKSLNLEHGFSVKSHVFEIFGLCIDCQK